MPVITTGLTIVSKYGSWYFDELPIRADDTSADQFCTDKGYGSMISYTQDGPYFSNDGGHLMNYYGPIFDITGGTAGNEWQNSFGYDSMITSITT